MNTYFPPKRGVSLPAGAKSIALGAVPSQTYTYLSYGITPIRAGDMLLIIQMQDATIQYTNDAFYGSNNDKAGNDGLGGTGYTSLSNTGKFEYVIANNAVPLSGGVLNFRGAGAGKGTVNAYTNEDATPNRGRRKFQVIRVPQYSNLTLAQNIYTSPFNGEIGGVIAYNVSGTMNLSGFQIDVSAGGFRGGLRPKVVSKNNLIGNYVTFADSSGSSKGEGIAGTPIYVVNFINQVTNPTEGLPVGSYGKGAPGNAGGGGNEFNAGGGGGGNGGAAGVGGNGASALNAPGSFPNGGRPGSANYDPLTPELSRLIMGGGGGAGAGDGSRGGFGGGIIVINAGRITGTGKILSNGGSGYAAQANDDFDAAGGGGAGGTVLIKVTNPDPSASLTIEAKGGNGGSVLANAGGPGGGGGGGEVFYSVPPASVNVNVGKGTAGFIHGTHNFAAEGQDGHTAPFAISSLPPYLQGGGSFCYPELNTVITSVTPTGIQYAGATVNYQINTTNYSGGGTAAGVQIQVKLPPGFLYSSATVTYTGDSSGPATVNNLSGDTNQLLFGNFNISPGDQVQLTLTASIPCGTKAGIYKSNAQALYLDPTRTLADTARRITPVLNAFPGSNTSYETGISGPVAGSNYNGNLSTTSDVTVGVPNIQNEIKAPLTTTFCTEGNPDPIEGSAIVAGTDSYTYQWQSSSDGITYQDIAGAMAKDYTPPLIQQTIYYRRTISYSGCTITQLISNVVKFNVIMPPDAVDFDMPDICLKDASAKFNNKTIVTDDEANQITYLWDFGDPGSANPTATTRDGQHVYTHTGEYLTKLTVFRNGCGRTLTKTFRVNGSAPKAGFTVQNSTALCSGREVLFEDHATVDFGEITRIDWYYDAQNNPTVVETDNSPGLRHATPKLYKHLYPVFNTPATKVFQVRMVVYSGLSCIDEQTIPITLQAVPEVVFDVIPTSICSSSAPIQLTQGREASGQLPGKGTYTGDGVSASGLFDPNAAGTGKHTLTYSFTTDNGCSSIAKTQDIIVFGTPAVDAGKDQVVLEGREVQLTAAVTASPDLTLSYKWIPSTGLDKDNILNPVASPSRDITYQLTVTTAQGCFATDDVFVHVLQNPEIPNTFTPNGDGINDEWNIKYLSSYPQATVNVFNRYGGKVYSATGAAKNWDGKYNGEYVPAGVYYYVIDPKNGRKILSGTLTVLK
ncbi:gliding motility-associated-like protein [Pedobacter cryoconitis]|uniref:Gliding motility-associated-like protein n=2 Tax=Pedobacter cryoconitis TaxID=188932 RepID=A0A327SRV7_9SPHI|nr:gliding motility-associated-like protein [Pedobacter cryoconitis]